MATITSEPPPMMRRDPSPVLSTTRESFVPRILIPDQVEPLRAVLLLQPVVQFLPARCPAQELAAMTLVHPPECPMLHMPSLTPSPGQPRGRMFLQILLFHHQEISLEETVAYWTIQPNYHMTAMDFPPNIQATVLALLLQQRKDLPMRCIKQDRGAVQGQEQDSKALKQAWQSMGVLLASRTHPHPLTIPKDTHNECRLMCEENINILLEFMLSTLLHNLYKS